MSTEFELPELKQAIGRLDDLFATAFSSNDEAMQDWVAVRFAIKAQSAPSNSDCAKLLCELRDEIVLGSIAPERADYYLDNIKEQLHKIKVS